MIRASYRAALTACASTTCATTTVTDSRRWNAVALHHILVTAVYQALEESEPDGKVTVSSEKSGKWLVFVVEGEGPLERLGDAVLRGRGLSHAVAEAILQKRGGKAAVSSVGERSRFEAVVPAVS